MEQMREKTEVFTTITCDLGNLTSSRASFLVADKERFMPSSLGCFK